MLSTHLLLTKEATMGSMTIRQAIGIVQYSHVQSSPSGSIVHKPPSFTAKNNVVQFLKLVECSSKRERAAASKASSTDSVSPAYGDEEGVSLGTMKLPSNTDLPRFETLLFQWGNSLCQGANLPLPAPLKVDKIHGGARLGFTTIGDGGQTEVLVHIDCLVFPATGSSPPMFQAIRNGPRKDRAPPGEPRIMRSLLDALKKCVELARI